MADRLKQESGDDSVNLQVAGNCTIGISFEDARQIALGVFKANFYDLSEKAAKIALQRAEEMTDEFLNKFHVQMPNQEHKLQEPSIQYSMFKALRNYAKTGDTDLKEQLLELLLQRIDSDERSLKQIVLDRAIEILPYATSEQIKLLTFVFIVENLAKNIFSNGLVDNKMNMDVFLDNLRKFSDIPHKNIRQSFNCHLEGLGCITEPTYQNSGLLHIHNINNFISKYRGIDINDVNGTIIESVDINLSKWYKTWQRAKTPTKILTTIGIVIAIINYNKQTNSNIKIEEFI
jgi:hypothetical protein